MHPLSLAIAPPWDGARFVGASSCLWWVPQTQTLLGWFTQDPGWLQHGLPMSPKDFLGARRLSQTTATAGWRKPRGAEACLGLGHCKGSGFLLVLLTLVWDQSFWPSPSAACLSRGAWVWAQKLSWCSCGRCIGTVWCCGRWTCPDAGQHSLCWLCLLWCSSKSSGVVALR